MTLFLGGLFTGGALTYAWLVFACQRAAERFEDTLRDELQRSNAFQDEPKRSS